MSSTQSQPAAIASTYGGARGFRSIRQQLLVTVNVILVLGLTLLGVADYWQGSRQRLEERQRALAFEAQFLLLPLARMHRMSGEMAGRDGRPLPPEGRERGVMVPGGLVEGGLRAGRGGPAGGVQQVIDTICQRMQTSGAPGHHIAVRLGEEVCEAQGGADMPQGIFAAMQQAVDRSDRRGQANGRPIVVGAATSEDVTVYVSEFVDDIVQEARRAFFWRLLAMVSMGVGLTVAINLALVRLLAPLQGLAQMLRRIGHGELGVQADGSNSAELQALVDEVNSMSRQLAAAQTRRQRELDKARRIQENLRPRLTGEGLPVRVVHRAASEVAGDYFDLHMLADERMVLCIADVTGHGIPAAMGAAMLKMLFGQACEQSDDPVQVLARINAAFCTVSLEGDFASMLVAVVDPAQGRLRYASAGHEPGVVVGADGRCRELESTGPLLGLDEQGQWHCVDVDLAPGERLFVWTDGLAETRDSTGRFFGRPALREVLARHNDQPLQQMVEAIMQAIDQHRGPGGPDDDLTLVALEAPRSA